MRFKVGFAKTFFFLYTVAAYMHWTVFEIFGPYFHPALVILVLVSVYSTVMLLENGRFYMGVESAPPFMILLFINISLLGALYALVSDVSISYDNFSNEYSTRYIIFLLNFVVFLWAITLVHVETSSESSSYFFIKSVFIMLLVVILAAVYQYLSHTYGYHYFLPSGRTYEKLGQNDMAVFRSVGFVKEPSYLAPMIIEYLIVVFLLFKKRLMLALFFMAIGIYSLKALYSFSAFMEVAIIACAFVMLKVRWSYRLLFILLSFVVVYHYSVDLFSLKGYYFDRLIGMLDYNASGRAFGVWIVFDLMRDAPLFNQLFGFGSSSYSLIGDDYFLAGRGVPVHTTSNSLYIDILFEFGIFGFLSYAGAVGYLLFKTLSNDDNVSLLILLHFLIYPMYRSDFASAHYFLVLVLFFVAKKEYYKKLNESFVH